MMKSGILIIFSFFITGLSFATCPNFSGVWRGVCSLLETSGNVRDKAREQMTIQQLGCDDFKIESTLKGRDEYQVGISQNRTDLINEGRTTLHVSAVGFWDGPLLRRLMTVVGVAHSNEYQSSYYAYKIDGQMKIDDDELVVISPIHMDYYQVLKSPPAPLSKSNTFSNWVCRLRR